MRNNLLITTALDFKDKKYKKKYCLSHWCNDFKTNNQYKNLIYTDHHWTNKKKALNNKKHINKIINQLLDYFFPILNKIHNLNYKKEYWKIILYPWLLHYTIVCFDRWEQIKKFTSSHKKKSFFILDYQYSSLDYIFNTHGEFYLATNQDSFNSYLINKIFKCTKYNNIEFKKSKSIIKKDKLISDIAKKPYNFFFKNIFEKVISRLFINLNSIYFDKLPFLKIDFFKLCLNLNLLPLKNNNFFENKYRKNIDYKKRKEIKKKSLNRKNTDPFISFLFENFSDFIPLNFVENFSEIRKDVKNYCKEKKIILSTYSYHGNEVFRTFLAEAKLRGSRLFLTQHGGGLESKLNFYEEYPLELFDKKIVFSKRNISKSVKILPTSLPLISINKNIIRKNLTLAITEYRQFPLNVAADLLNEERNQNTESLFSNIKILKPEIQNQLKIRRKDTYKISFFKYLFEKIYKNNKNLLTSPNKNFKEVLNESKIIIHNHSSTAFSESMYHNIPTLLILDTKKVLFDQESIRMIKILKKNKIVFENYSQLFDHVNKVWNKTDLWWNKKSIQNCRKMYLNNFFITEKNYMNKWLSFLKNELAKLKKKNK